MKSNLSIELVISDYNMPSQDGLSFINECRKSGLCEKFILVTGTIDDIETEMEKYGERPNVIHRKPFEIDDLVKDIRSIFFDLQKISA